MKHRRPQQAQRTHAARQRGVTLLETFIALMIMVIVAGGLMGVFGYAAGQNKSQGEIATRTTEYAEDKMEQLMALDFGDAVTNTTVYPSQPAGGSGLGGLMAGNQTVGGTDPKNPLANYADYLDGSGTVVNNAAAGFYTRVWSIGTDATGNLKTITVVVGAKSTGGGTGGAPSTKLVCLKTNN